MRFYFSTSLLKFDLYSVANYSAVSPFSSIPEPHHPPLFLFSTRSVTSNEAQLCARAHVCARTSLCVLGPCVCVCIQGGGGVQPFTRSGPCHSV